MLSIIDDYWIWKIFLNVSDNDNDIVSYDFETDSVEDDEIYNASEEIYNASEEIYNFSENLYVEEHYDPNDELYIPPATPRIYPKPKTFELRETIIGQTKKVTSSTSYDFEVNKGSGSITDVLKKVKNYLSGNEDIDETQDSRSSLDNNQGN